MKTRDVRLNVDYKFNGNLVKVIKRIKNSYTEKWQIGWGNKFQKIKHQSEMTFLLNNGTEVYANQLKQIK